MNKNQKANQILREIFWEKGIMSCELMFKGCLGTLFTAFAHRHKRVWYYDKPELLIDFNQVVLACQHCHDKIEHNKKLTEEVFEKLRGEDN